MASWRKEHPFPIIYEKQSNQGKHIAVNRGAQLARGELFLIADSDDSFPSNALQIFHKAWAEIPKTERTNYRVTGLCIDQSDNIVGDEFPLDVLTRRS